MLPGLTSFSKESSVFSLPNQDKNSNIYSGKLALASNLSYRSIGETKNPF